MIQLLLGNDGDDWEFIRPLLIKWSGVPYYMQPNDQLHIFLKLQTKDNIRRFIK